MKWDLKLICDWMDWLFMPEMSQPFPMLFQMALFKWAMILPPRIKLDMKLDLKKLVMDIGVILIDGPSYQIS